MANKQQTSTSTQIRNFYSEEMAYMNISFFNTNLSFRFYPYVQKDQSGRSTYDMKNGINTTVNFEGAYALWDAAKGIIEGRINEMNLPIPCAAGAELTLERKLGQNGSMETIFSISKNNMTIPFKFRVSTYQTKENGQVVTRVVECGLGAFMKTIEGYLTGINADRHLDKLTEDFVKLQENNGGNNGGNNQYQNNGNNSYKKNYNNNNNGYRRQYNNYGGGNGNQNTYGNNSSRQQNYSSYQIGN